MKCGRIKCRGAAVLAGMLLLALPAAAVQDDTGAPSAKKEERLEDRLVPIPTWQKDVENNGCRLHTAPTPYAPDGLASLTEIPFWQLIQNEAGPYSVRDILDPPEKFMASLAPLDPEMRTLVLLHTLQNALGAEGLHTYFYLKAGRNAPAVRDALAAAGLAGPHRLFVEAMSLFGSSYPVDDEQRGAFFGYAAEPQELNAFDHRLLALAKEFGTRHTWTGTIVDYVNRSPALWKRIEAARMRLSDMHRFEHLTGALLIPFDFWKPYAEIEQRLTTFTREQRTLLLLAAFNYEFENGGVHQFFYNGEGAIAPDVQQALLEIGLDRQAALVQRGIDMFAGTYLRDTEQRREAHFHNHDGWTRWDQQLSGLTDEFYALDGGPQVLRIGGDMQIQGGPGLRYAMLAFAKHHNMLPC
ncbi:MAG: DUF4375 domain-containing protein [Hyphomicrobium sp.]|uniref:DMP19 family protein n=1 Tax=Hyphomicrobium sp. TaxID=82 RepID=UPI003D0FAF55